MAALHPDHKLSQASSHLCDSTRTARSMRYRGIARVQCQGWPGEARFAEACPVSVCPSPLSRYVAKYVLVK